MANLIRNDIYLPTRLVHEMADRHVWAWTDREDPKKQPSDEIAHVCIYTKWEPPMDQFCAMAKRYPDDYFHLEWCDPSNDYAGTFGAKSGKVSFLGTDAGWKRFREECFVLESKGAQSSSSDVDKKVQRAPEQCDWSEIVTPEDEEEGERTSGKYFGDHVDDLVFGLEWTSDDPEFVNFITSHRSLAEYYLGQRFCESPPLLVRHVSVSEADMEEDELREYRKYINEHREELESEADEDPDRTRIINGFKQVRQILVVEFERARAGKRHDVGAEHKS